MTKEAARILQEARNLSPMERAELIEKLLDSFTYDQRKKIDEAWAQEAESRIDAYEKGAIESIPLSKVFEEIEHKDLK